MGIGVKMGLEWGYDGVAVFKEALNSVVWWIGVKKGLEWGYDGVAVFREALNSVVW